MNGNVVLSLTRACTVAMLTTLAATPSLHVAAADAPNAHVTKSGAPRSDEIDWQTSPLDLDLRGMNGERYTFRCPPGKPLPRLVVGSGPYADNSSICSASVHAGAIHAKDGGEVAIEIRPGQSHYASSERNYVKSGDYDGAWNGSFIVLGGGAPANP